MSRGRGGGKAALPPSARSAFDAKQLTVSEPTAKYPERILPMPRDPHGPSEERMMAIWEELDGWWRNENTHTVNVMQTEQKKVERYSDRYVKGRREQNNKLCLETDPSLYPDELMPIVTGSNAMAAQRKTTNTLKKRTTLSDTLAKLAEMDDADQEEAEEEEDEVEQEAEPEEEEEDYDNDYAQSYFDNGEDYYAGEDGGGDEEGPIY